MRIKRLLLFSLLLCSLMFTTSPIPAFACSCEQTKFETAYERSAVIFIGKVTELQSNPQKLGDDIAKARTISFQVDAVYKGAATKQQKVYDYGPSASCGYPFKIGSTYLVYAYEKDGELFTSLCSRNSKLDASGNEDMDKLKKLQPVSMPAVTNTAADEQATREFFPNTAIVQTAVAAGILLLGAIAYRYLRSRKKQ